MTNEEAIHILKEQIIGIEETHTDCIDSYLVDIDAIKTGISALEKHIPIKVVRDSHDIAFCPACGVFLWQNADESVYCFKCGQKLEW